MLHLLGAIQRVGIRCNMFQNRVKHFADRDTARSTDECALHAVSLGTPVRRMLPFGATELRPYDARVTGCYVGQAPSPEVLEGSPTKFALVASGRGGRRDDDHDGDQYLGADATSPIERLGATYE